MIVAAFLFLAASVHEVRTGQNAQAIVDAAKPGDRVVFRPGLHVQKLGKHRSMVYVDKPLDIELETGAVLKLADGQSQLERIAEITTDHGAPKTIDDFEAGGSYDLGLGEVIYTIRIDGEGTFTWAVAARSTSNTQKFLLRATGRNSAMASEFASRASAVTAWVACGSSPTMGRKPTASASDTARRRNTSTVFASSAVEPSISIARRTRSRAAW